jgi:tripartite-type tricarboxylate transporter receptor subunit TctC
MRWFMVLLLVFTLWTHFAVVSAYSSEEVNFDGKRVRIIVGLSAGGGFDTYARLIARHLAKHLPGNPTIIVENRPGAGGLVAANYVFNVAKPDGLTVGTYPGPIILRDVLGYEGVELDGRKFGWLGATAPAAQACALTKASGIKSVDDWLAAKRPIRLGGLSPGSDTVDLPKLVKSTTKLPIQVVEGYGGVSRVRVAAEAGEVDGVCFNWYGMKATWGQEIKSGNVHVVLQNVLEPVAELKGVPLVSDYAKDEESRQLLRAALKAYSVPMYVYNTPPDTPVKHLEVLQKALLQTLEDPDLLAEAKRAKLEIIPVDGPSLTATFTDIYEINPSLVTGIKEVVFPKK